MLNTLNVLRAEQILQTEARSVLFVTPLLRAREIKMAHALRAIGWKVVLIYLHTTPFSPRGLFDVVIRASSPQQAHNYAKQLGPKLCHVFSGSVDDMTLLFCRHKPGPVIIDLNDVFSPSLFDYCHERFEPTRECLQLADGLCARDLQAKTAGDLDGFTIPKHVVFFPEYSSRSHPQQRETAPKRSADEVHVVSVGTFCLESLGMHDSGYLRLANLLTDNRIHLHIYPNWTYRKKSGSAFNWSVQKHFSDFIELQNKTPYLRVHDSVPLDQLAYELPQYDFGIVSGGSPALQQHMKILKPPYLGSCYSGRISDYLDARLPVLVNREIAFDYWLLNRYHIAVDLEGVLQPGFREKLLALKQDNAMRHHVERAAEILSLEQNIGRLAAFYETVVAENHVQGDYLGRSWAMATHLPVLGPYFKRPLAALRHAGQVTVGLRNALTAEREENVRKTQLLRSLQSAWRAIPQGTSTGSGHQHSQVPGHTGIADSKLHFEIEWGSRLSTGEVSGLLNWKDASDVGSRSNGMFELLEMSRIHAAGRGLLNNESSCWSVLNYKNFNQLLTDGYRNFKRTIGCNYFNFMIQDGDPQLAFLEAQLSDEDRKTCRQAADAAADDPEFSWKYQAAYRYFILLLWTYVSRVDTAHILDQVQEPDEGNPVTVDFRGRRATQDLANSVLEYYSMAEGVDFGACRRVLEIGGGYGRDAHVVLALNPHLQYTLVDIPPALFIAQRYLTSIFGDRRVFTARDFDNYESVRTEMERASIVFLLPHQLELMPRAHFDFSLNISSFGEMQTDQITAYFELLEKVTAGHFYMKQWKISRNAFDKLALTEQDYPVSSRWSKVFSRTCRVQTEFFEAMYRTGLDT